MVDVLYNRLICRW